MARYHINPATEAIAACRAKKRCPFGDSEDHFTDKGAAQEYVEERARLEGLLAAAKAKKAQGLPTTLRALTAPLEWKGEQPPWIKELGDERYHAAGFPEGPRLVDRFEADGQPVNVVWEEFSTADNDYFIMMERGYKLNRLGFYGDRGETLGYLKIGYANGDSLKMAFGEDEWASLRWLEDYNGGNLGFRTYGEKFSDPPTDSLRGKTGEELLAAKKRIWAKAHATMEVCPEGFDRSQLTWGSLINLKPDHAPTDEAELDRQLDGLRAIADQQQADFLIDQTPSIDYASIEAPLRGRGLGQSMYVYSARILGERGLKLRASGLQTNFAEAVWQRMAETPGLPMRVIRNCYKRKGSTRTTSHLAIDFT